MQVSDIKKDITNTLPLSQYLAELKYEDIPESAIEQAKKITMHVIAASIAAIPQEMTGRCFKMAEAKGGAPEATVWGSNGKKVPVEEAAFANGTISDIMDWEDCSWTGHPSAGVIPAAFAVAEAQNSNGKDYLTAVVAGYEGYQRIAMAIQPSPNWYKLGKAWGLCTWQIYAASLAAAKMKNFNTVQFMQTIGASVYQTIAPITKHGNGPAKSDLYHYQHGFCARNGVAATTVTEYGFDNLYDGLDGTDGLWNAVSDMEDASWYAKDLGEKWLIEETYLKHWPANMWVQTPLEALDIIMQRRPFTADEVSKVRVAPNIPFICGDYFESTKGELDAQFSIPYCLTSYILNPVKGAHWFSEEMRNSQVINDFSTKYEYFGELRGPKECFDEFKEGTFPEVTIEVELNDGTKESHTMRYPKGHPLNNFTMQEECDHFREITAPFMSKEQIETIIEKIVDLDKLDNFAELAELTAIK